MRNRTIKLLFVLLIFTVSLIILTGCKSKEEKLTEALIEAISGNNRLTVWDKIWNFIKKNWIALLIIFGIIVSIIEFLSEKIKKIVKYGLKKKKIIEKYGSRADYKEYKYIRDRVCSANPKPLILVYGLGGRNNIKSIKIDNKNSEDDEGKLLIEVNDALAVNINILEFVYGVSSFEYCIVEMSKIKNVENVKDELTSYIETITTDIPELIGLYDDYKDE